MSTAQITPARQTTTAQANSPRANAATADRMVQSTEQLVSQLVLAASWDFSDDQPHPMDAAVKVLDIDPGDPRLPLIRAQVAAAVDLNWTEQTGLAIHLLLEPPVARLVAA